MGTRHLIMVVQKGKVKVAQYSQWDGYPSGNGKDILEFLSKVDLPKFKKQVAKLRWMTDNEIELIQKDDNWIDKYPHISRDAGSKILGAIHFGKIKYRNWKDNIEKTVDVKVDGLVNSEDFAGDSLFCEWAYVLDLDKNVLECYRGFVKGEQKRNRFTKYTNKGKDVNGYSPVELVKKYHFDNLPNLPQFVFDLTRIERMNDDIEEFLKAYALTTAFLRGFKKEEVMDLVHVIKFKNKRYFIPKVHVDYRYKGIDEINDNGIIKEILANIFAVKFTRL